MTPTFISICIPAFRAERYLAATLASVRHQTYPLWELIVVEDGSCDGTRGLVSDLAASVPQRVRYLHHAENRGLPATRNTGIAAADAPWVALLDSDDLWTPDHLESLAAIARSQEADLIHAGSRLFQSDTGQDLGLRAPTPAMLASFPRSLFTGDYIIQPASVLLRQALWARVGGFDPAFRYVEDRDMWLRCARAGARFYYTGRATCRYRKHGAALSTHAAAMAEATGAVFDKHLDWAAIPRDLRRRLTAEAWAAAGKLRQRGDPQRARRHFLHACATQWRLGWWLRATACGLLGSVRPGWPARPAPSLS
jgi:glycosyltransferase involved in cell wall biosynthesis